MAETNRSFSLRALGMGAFYVIGAPAAIGGGLALAPLQALIGLLFAPWERIKALPRALGLSGAALLLFIGWALVSLIWTPSANAPQQAIKTVAGVITGIGFVAIAAAASDAQRRLIQRIAAAGLALLAALCLIEAFADMPINYLFQPHAEHGMLERNPAKGVTILLCWMWPVIGALAGGSTFERTLWRVLFICAMIACFFFGVDANIAVAVIGLIAYAFGYVLPRVAPALILTIWAGWLVASPWVLPLIAHSALLAQMPQSWRHRGAIWTYAADKIQANPILGYGLDSARTFNKPRAFEGMQIPAIPLHPHSGSLQIWFELGVVGVALAALALLLGAWRAANAFGDQPARAGAFAACAVAIGFYWNFSVGLWQEWYVAVAFGAAALVAALDRPEKIGG